MGSLIAKATDIIKAQLNLGTQLLEVAMKLWTAVQFNPML